MPDLAAIRQSDGVAISHDVWKICWPVIAAFYVKPTNQFDRLCLICNTSVPPGNFCSSFLSDAVDRTCQHRENGFICSACDEDFLLRVSLQKQECLELDCPGKLSIKIAEIEARLGDSKPFQKYCELVFSTPAECIVCGEMDQQSTKPVTKQCRHFRNTCSDCLAQMVDVSVKSGRWDELRCPETKCKKKLEYEDVQRVASKETFLRYDDLLTERMAKRIRNFTPCNRPGGECQAGQIHEAGDTNPQMQCYSCNYMSCFSCSAAWHEGQTCSQAHSLLPEDPASDEFKRKYCKRCPGVGCGMFTKKDGACHEMECVNPACRVMWCWECKLIMNREVLYSNRALTLHTAACNAPVVRSKRQLTGFQSVPKPGPGDGKYRSGWDKDEGFVGTGEEY